MTRTFRSNTALLTLLAMLVVACSSDDSPGDPAPESSESDASSESPADGDGDGDADLMGNGQAVVAFTWAGTNSYVAEWQRGAREEAERLDFDLTIIENNFDQNEQDVQVQQALAGAEPAAWVWWPNDDSAGISSLRALEQSGVPVLQANVPPSEQSAEYIELYAGTNFFDNGVTAGEALLQARETAREAGMEFHSDEGNLIVVAWPQGLTLTEDKVDGLMSAIENDPFNLLTVAYGNDFDNASGYEAMSALIPAYRDQGIDFVFAHNDAVSLGVIQALNEAGYTPGEDVYVVGANCHGDLSALVSGEQYASMLVAARYEGKFFIHTLARYLAHGGEVLDGVFNAPFTEDAFPEITGPPHKMNYLPQPSVIFHRGSPEANEEVLKEAKIWGLPFDEACTY